MLIRDLIHIPAQIKAIPSNTPTLRPPLSMIKFAGKFIGINTITNMSPMKVIALFPAP